MNGAPYIKIYDYLGNDITPAGVHELLYVHSEKSTDYSEIHIENQDKHMADYPAFQEGAMIKIEWGYIGGETRKAVVFIGDIKFTYDGTIKAIIHAYDLASYMKNNHDDAIRTKATMDDVAQQICDKYGIKYNGIVDENGSKLIKGKWDSNVQLPNVLNENGYNTLGRDHTAVPRTHFLKIYDEAIQGNKSDFQHLDELKDNEPGGPWVLETHDDELTIKKRNFNQAPIRSYIYKGEPGTLLEFQPQGKNKTKKGAASGITIQGWNPETKEHTQLSVTPNSNTDTKLAGGNDDNPDGTNEESFLNKVVKGTTTLLFPFLHNSIYNNEEQESKPISSDITIGSRNPPLPPNIKPGVNSFNPQYDAALNFGLVPGLTLSPDPHKVVKGEARKFSMGAKDLIEHNPFVPLSSESVEVNVNGVLTTPTMSTATITQGYVWVKQNKVINTPGPDKSDKKKPEELYVEADSVRQQAELDKNMASAKILGDSILQSGKLINISNVANKHTGNYYIVKASHRINSNDGYIVDLELTRNAVGLTGNTQHTVVKANKNYVNKAAIAADPTKHINIFGDPISEGASQSQHLNHKGSIIPIPTTR